MTSDMTAFTRMGTLILVFSTLLATVFVAIQAWYARLEVVDNANLRLLENKLDICIESFDAAADLDQALRAAAPGMGLTEVWPPKIIANDVDTLERLQRDVVPHLHALESSLLKATILGELDKFRAYLVQELNGLSKELLDLPPARIDDPEVVERKDAVLDQLSEFLGAQYPVLTGCRLVAEGKA
ncbi:MAG: hypothetical protein AAGF71_09290 [Pseudomonadota bacterium]